MKLDAIKGDAVWSLVLFDLDTIGIVRAHFVERQDVQHHKR